VANVPPELNLDDLTIPQRLDLITRLWDSIPETVEAMPVPDWHWRELEHRLRGADLDPDAAIPWDTVKKRLRSQD